MNNSNITYNILFIDEIDEIIPVAVDQFVLGESATRAIYATPDDFKPMLSDGVRKWVAEGLSYGARDSETGQLVGVAISTLITKKGGTPEIWSDLKSTNPKTQAYVAYEKMIEKQVDIFELYPSAEKILEINLLVTLPSYRGRKIGHSLIKHAVNMGRIMGCSIAMAEASGRASQKILSNVGFKTVFEYEYENFEIDGKKVYDISVMGDDLSDMIMVMELSTSRENSGSQLSTSRENSGSQISQSSKL